MKFLSFLTSGLDRKIKQLSQEIRSMEKQIGDELVQSQAWIEHGTRNTQKLPAYFKPLILQNTQTIQQWVCQCPLPSHADWAHKNWLSWEGDSFSRDLLCCIRYGEMIEKRSGIEGQPNDPFSLPAYAPFIGKNRTIIVRSRYPQKEHSGRSLLQSLLIRTALMLPHQSSYTLLDPAGLGSAFPMQGSLPNEQQSSDDLARDLALIIEDIQRINRDYLNENTGSFDQLPDDARVIERYHFIFAADFPDGYDRRAIEALQRIAKNGPKAGRYLFIHYNAGTELPRDVTIDDFKNAFFIDIDKEQSLLPDMAIRFDTAPGASLQTTLLNTLKRIKPVDRPIEWDEVAGIAEDVWWIGDSSEFIEAPIGKRASGEMLSLWFGEKGTRPCIHGVLGGSSGYGKSVLLNSLTLALALRYSPEDLRFYLIDGKAGDEFAPFARFRLPHAEAVSLYTEPEVSRTLLDDLVEEMEHRSVIFQEHQVKNLRGYRQKGSPEGKLPRIVVVVDEYQELFEDDIDGRASDRLLKLSQQGRFVGIHLILSSQSFDVQGILHRDKIFTNMHLRLAMALPRDDIRALTEFDAQGKMLIENCDRAGKVVVSEMGSEIPNVAGRATLLLDDRTGELLQQMKQKSDQRYGEHVPLIFNGREQPAIIHNPHIVNLLHRLTYPSQEEMQSYARQDIRQGGLGINDWYASQQPVVMWLGQELNVRGHAKIILRRRVQEHILVVGANNAIRYGMLAAILVSLALSTHPTRTKFVIIDKSIPESEWGGTLRAVCDTVLRPAEFSVGFTRKDAVAMSMIETLAKEIEQRRALDSDARSEQPSIFAVMTELETVDTLLRTLDVYDMEDSPHGKLLKQIVAEGPGLGIHLVLSFDCVGAMKQILDMRRELEYFRHRVALQMGEDDSFDFVRNRKASLLGTAKPVKALYLDTQSNVGIQFKPYSIEQPQTQMGHTTSPAFDEQLSEIHNRLAARRG